MSPIVRAPSSENDLPEIVTHRLSLYYAAAVAAGVGIVALAAPASAEVVITHKTLFLGNGADGSPPVTIDFNNDGMVDVSFQQASADIGYGYADALASVRPGAGGAVITRGAGSQSPYAAALLRGVRVGPSAHFGSAKNIIIERTSEGTSNHFSKCGTDRHLYGHFPGSRPDRFVGIMFLIHGVTHFGWVRVSVDTTVEHNCALRTKITAYAYETVPNKAITIGGTEAEISENQAAPASSVADRPSLGALALGVEGLSLWRSAERITP
jgi:hypothetical protein